MNALYWSRSARQFLRTAGPDTISTPASVVARILDDQRNGKDIPCGADGTPNDVLNLLTVTGMRNAVFAEVRMLRALILNALSGIGYDAMRAGNEPLMREVDAARLFLKNITTDADVLAVTLSNGGWAAMGDLVLYKWMLYAKNASPTIRAAFAEVA